MGTGIRGIIVLAFIFAGTGLFLPQLSAQNVRVGLFDDQSIKTLVFHCQGGTYDVYGDSVFYREIKTGELVYIFQPTRNQKC
jgi:hypothetical protein